jgi:hypothetical protein
MVLEFKMGLNGRMVGRATSRKARGGEKKFKPEIYEGLQVAARKPKASVKTVVVLPKMSNDEMKGREGTYFTDKDADQIFDENVDLG